MLSFLFNRLQNNILYSQLQARSHDEIKTKTAVSELRVSVDDETLLMTSKVTVCSLENVDAK